MSSEAGNKEVKPNNGLKRTKKLAERNEECDQIDRLLGVKPNLKLIESVKLLEYYPQQQCITLR